MGALGVRFLTGRFALWVSQVPRRGYSLDVGQIVVAARVLEAFAVGHTHAHATPDEAELRAFDP